MLSYSNFLSKTKEFSEAYKMYLATIKEFSHNSKAFHNFAKFLALNLRQISQCEHLSEESILLQADEYFKKAIDLDKNDPSLVKDYLRFLQANFKEKTDKINELDQMSNTLSTRSLTKVYVSYRLDTENSEEEEKSSSYNFSLRQTK